MHALLPPFSCDCWQCVARPTNVFRGAEREASLVLEGFLNCWVENLSISTWRLVVLVRTPVGDINVYIGRQRVPTNDNCSCFTMTLPWCTSWTTSNSYAALQTLQSPVLGQTLQERASSGTLWVEGERVREVLNYWVWIYGLIVNSKHQASAVQSRSSV